MLPGVQGSSGTVARMRVRRQGHEPRLGTLRSLRIRNYRLYCAGQLSSLCGTWMQSVAIAWLVLDLTDSATQVGLVTAAQFVPVLVLAGPAGVLIDRLDRRRAVVGAELFLLAQAVILTTIVVTDVVAMWMVIGLSLWQGIGNSMEQPSRQSLLSELVAEEDLPNAVSLNAALFTIARVAGPAVAAVLISVSGVALCFIINALSFIGIIAAVVAIRPAELHHRPRVVRAKGQLREGVSFAWRSPTIRPLLVSASILGLFTQHGQVILPLMARETFDGGAGTFGTMAAINSLGACFAAFWLAGASPPSDRRIMLFATVLGASALGTAASPDLVLVLLVLPVLGFANLGAIVTTNAANQLRSPPPMRGRLIALYFAISSGSAALGSLLMGMLVDAVGPRLTLVVGAVVCFVVAIAWRLNERASPRGEARPGVDEVVALAPGLDA
jgi:MFS family permease